MTDDPVMDEIQAAIGLLHRGERDGARLALARIWRDISAAPRPMHECVLAHFMADAQDDVDHELAWDLRAYDAARRSGEADARLVDQGLSIGDFMPSLHLNLADDYHRLGLIDAARRHLDEATACLTTAPASPYMDTIRGAVARLEQRLAGAPDTD